MGKPIVAIVGRPNVGKSTLFNKLVGQRLAIVEDTPGVTRDRLYGNCEWQDRRFLLIDTGGIEFDESNHILKSMRQQAQLAMDEADVILFLVDGRSGLTTADEEVARLLRSTKKPVILAVNKDKNAPIYKDADAGIVGDLYKVTPMLIEAIRAAKAAK